MGRGREKQNEQKKLMRTSDFMGESSRSPSFFFCIIYRINCIAMTMLKSQRRRHRLSMDKELRIEVYREKSPRQIAKKLNPRYARKQIFFKRPLLTFIQPV